MASHDKDTNDLESPLGLAQEPIATKPEDHLQPGDPSTRRARARALGEDGMDPADVLGEINDRDGATGIDMGSGGTGTDLKPGSPKR